MIKFVAGMMIDHSLLLDFKTLDSERMHDMKDERAQKNKGYFYHPLVKRMGEVK